MLLVVPVPVLHLFVGGVLRLGDLEHELLGHLGVDLSSLHLQCPDVIGNLSVQL